MRGNRRAWSSDIPTRRWTIAAVAIVLACAMGIGPGAAQSTIVVPNAGEVTTTTRVDNGVLAVTNQVIRNRSQVRECIGICFYASRTATKTWICRQSDCALDCFGREPVGGC